jgi:cytochrome P450
VTTKARKHERPSPPKRIHNDTVAGDLLTRLLEPGNLADPYPLYAHLRERDPVQVSGEWVFTRYDDVTTVLRDPRFGRARVPRFPLGSVGVVLRMFLLLDPPDHARLRRGVARLFTASAIAGLRPLVTSAVEDLLRVGSEQLDVVGDLAQPLPLRVMAELLGIPACDRPRLAAWSRVLVDALDPPLPARPWPALRALQRRGDLPATLRATREMVRYARGALRGGRGETELLIALASAQGEGTMTEDEAVATWVMLLIAGHETTTHLIGNAVVSLLRHPDQLARLRSDPSLMAGAVEECLRYEGPIVRAGRLAHDDAMVGETRVRRGQLVHAFLGAANRDPDVFADPDRFDVGRPLVPAPVAFGSGIHFCLGATLARLETEVALSSLVARRPHLTLANDSLEWRPSLALRGLVSLPVELSGGRAGRPRQPLPSPPSSP